MKKINELTEQEIIVLSEDDVDLIIKLRKAEEGIKFVPRPITPIYFEVTPPDMTIYSCALFGDDLVFEDVTEANAVLDVIKNCTSKFRTDYNYNKLGSDFRYASSQLKKPYNGDWFTITSMRVYSLDLYKKICDAAQQNNKMKEQYDKELKEYESSVHDAQWIEDEINDRVREVREKFWKLESFCRKFRFDYLPLAENDEVIAMKFMDKAYSLTDEQKTYVLENHKNIE